MASLGSNYKIGNASPPSLIKSAATLQTQISTFNDDEARITYENSAKTASDLQTYTDYLNGRIRTLQSTGTVVDMTKALTMQQTIVTATHSNISADIVRENINLMSTGTSGTPQGYQDKMQVVGAEYTRALGVGDDALAQSLMSQYYSLSQSYQQAVQTASNAATTLANSNATYQGEVVTNLTAALKSFTGTAKNLSEGELNQTLSAWAKQNAGTMATLGVKINTDQPNYWDVAMGITGAIYNAKVLQAQAESVSNPLVSQTDAQAAQDYLTGTTKFDTLGGSLTVQQIAQAQQDPQMFAYDNTTGTYKLTQQTGYQYLTENGPNGQTSQVLAPTYSGMTQKSQYDKVFFLSPTQTTEMTKLGLNFSENKSGTTGNGVQIQATQSTPQWLQNIIGKGGVTNMYVSQNGFLQFEGEATAGQGKSFYTLASDSKGLGGLYEHLPDGSIQLAGGDYGFNAGSVDLLINKAQQQQATITAATAKMQAQLQTQLKPTVTVPQIQPQTQASTLQPAAAPQLTAPSPQAASNEGKSIQPTQNPQQAGTQNINQSGGKGVPLNAPRGGNASIAL